MKLTVGKKYQVDSLTFTGWTDCSSLNGECEPGATEGYNVSDYFDRDGVYLGQDEYGIEPLFDHTYQPENTDWRIKIWPGSTLILAMSPAYQGNEEVWDNLIEALGLTLDRSRL